MSAAMATTARGIPMLDSEHRKLAGVCSGIARHFDVSVRYVRLAFVVLTIAGGIGVALYGLAYLTMTATEADELGDPTAVLREAGASWREGLGAGIVAAAVAIAAGGGSHVALPVGVGVGAAMIVWRSGIGLTKRGRIGAALMVVGAVLVARALPALGQVQSVAFPVIVVLAGSVMLFGPWWLRMVQALTAERTARIRAQERAEVAAHLHDSVLQTLALIQRRADDPAEVAQLARRQERDLRAWLNADDTAARRHAARRAGARRRRDRGRHGVEVEVVCVGDRRARRRHGCAGVRGARGDPQRGEVRRRAGRIDVYAEASEERAEVFVRDRGAGFDPDAVPADRRGVRESIVGRMARHGGQARASAAAPGGGTEVELT